MAVYIREAGDSDLQAVLSVEREAFEASGEAEDVIRLVEEAFDDPSASPSVSLLAFQRRRYTRGAHSIHQSKVGYTSRS